MAPHVADLSAKHGRTAGIRGLANNKYVFGCAIFASMGGFLFGYDQGVMSNILTTQNFGAHFPDIYNDADIKGWIVSILQLGAWVGALSNGWVAAKFSRKYSMMIAVVIFCVGSALQAGAQNVGYIFAGRFIGGFAIGMLSHVVPMYQSEISPPEIRGSLVALQQFAITVGILVSFWLDYGFHFIGGVTCIRGADPEAEFNPEDLPTRGEDACNGQTQVTWRVPLALQILPALILAVGMLFYPFSPRWLAGKGRNEEALAVVAKLRRLPADSELVQTEYLEILAAVRFDEETRREKYPGKKGFGLGVAQYMSLLTHRPTFKRLAIGCVLQFFQQFTGINAIIYYAPTIFTGLGLNGTTTSLLATGVVGVVNVLATIPAILFLDTFGRRNLLMTGAAGMGASHIIVAGISGRYDGRFAQNKGAGWAAVAFIYVFIANFAYSWGPVGWVLPSEIFPLSIRSQAMSVTTSANWFCNFIIGRATPSMLRDIKFGTYIFFAAFCVLMFLWVWFFVPETKNRTLEEMDEVFKDTSARQDAERMQRIKQEVGLENAHASDDKRSDEEKAISEKDEDRRDSGVARA